MTETTLTGRPATADGRTARPRWALTATAAGACGVVATLVLDGRTSPGSVESDSLLGTLDPLTYRASMVVGYLAVVLLLVTAAGWRRHVEPRLPSSTAARVVSSGLLASAARLTYGYGWKGALGNYLPGGTDAAQLDTPGRYVYFVLTDFGPYIGWLGVVVAAGAVAHLGLRERAVPRWLGVVSLVPVLQTTLMVVGLGVPGVAALLGPLWLVVTGLALTLGGLPADD